MLILSVAVLLFILTWAGWNTNRAVYDKPVQGENSAAGKADIYALLHRFSGKSDNYNQIIEKVRKDTVNAIAIRDMMKAGDSAKLGVFKAYALYLEGILKTDIGLLQQSADLFFDAGTHDPDTMADRTTYSVYSKRACDRILLADPSNKAALTTKATCLVYFDGSVMEGVGLLRQVETIDSNYVPVQHHLMLLAIQSGQYEKAMMRLKKLLLLQPENEQYRELLIRLETQNIK